MPIARRREDLPGCKRSDGAHRVHRSRAEARSKRTSEPRPLPRVKSKTQGGTV